MERDSTTQPAVCRRLLPTECASESSQCLIPSVVGSRSDLNLDLDLRVRVVGKAAGSEKDIDEVESKLDVRKESVSADETVAL